MSTATQKRLERLEQAIKPKKIIEVGHFISTDYKNTAVMQKAIDTWYDGLQEGVKGIVIEHMLSQEKDKKGI